MDRRTNRQREEKREKNGGESAEERPELKPTGRSPDIRAKAIILAITGALAVVLAFILLRKPEPQKPVRRSHQTKLDFARDKRQEGLALMRKAEITSSRRDRNVLFKNALRSLHKSQRAYTELIDAHKGGKRRALEKEAGILNKNIKHCRDQIMAV